uniref:Uncharacterized protein n=1 Tax=Oryza brachyantha TaxID=4533 RepID=J3MA66_ORYBR
MLLLIFFAWWSHLMTHASWVDTQTHAKLYRHHVPITGNCTYHFTLSDNSFKFRALLKVTTTLFLLLLFFICLFSLPPLSSAVCQSWGLGE